MTTLRNQIHHDEVPAMRQPGDTMCGDMIIRDGRVISRRNRDGKWIDCTRSDAADGLPAGEFRYDTIPFPIEVTTMHRNDDGTTLSPEARDGIVNYLTKLHGSNVNRVELLAKSDAYLTARYDIARQHEMQQAGVDHAVALRGAAPAPAPVATRGDAAGQRFDAQSNHDAYQRAAADLNAWRNEPQQRADAGAHIQPVRRDMAQGGTRADADAAYQRSKDDLNSWRDE